jgi:hypothetical protein
MTEGRLVELALPNGAVALVSVTDPGEVSAMTAGATKAGATKAGQLDRYDSDELVGVLEGVAGALKTGLARAAPDKVTVKLGLTLVAKAGKLTALLVEGSGSATLEVTLEWRNGAQHSG